MPGYFRGTGTRWIDLIYVGSISLVLSLVLWMFPNPATSPGCTPGFVILGIVSLAGGLLRPPNEVEDQQTILGVEGQNQVNPARLGPRRCPRGLNRDRNMQVGGGFLNVRYQNHTC
jgi:hypothetical protein